MEKNVILVIVGCVGGFFTRYFGGWNGYLTTLCVFMLIDYITGIICAGVFKKSAKSADGGLESRAGWKGLARKFTAFLIVLIACRLDFILDTTFIEFSVVISFIANELISIIENCGIMGMPIPEVITKAITLLNEKEKEEK